MQKTTLYRKPMGENLFEEEFTIDALSQMGNPLERLAALVDFEMFRPALEEVLVKKDFSTSLLSQLLHTITSRLFKPAVHFCFKWNILRVLSKNHVVGPEV